jgi:hypothetical protein
MIAFTSRSEEIDRYKTSRVIAPKLVVFGLDSREKASDSHNKRPELVNKRPKLTEKSPDSLNNRLDSHEKLSDSCVSGVKTVVFGPRSVSY